MASSNGKHVRPESSDKRRRGNSFVYIGTVIILIITVVAFVFVPALGGQDTGNDLTFGSWDGKPVSFVYGGYFASQVQEIKAFYESRGYKDTGDKDFAYQVWRRAFDNTVIHLALLDYAKKADIAVSDAFLDERMLEHPAFMDGGSFSKRLYRERSNTEKLAIRKELEVDTLKGRYVRDSVSYLTGKAELAAVMDIAKARRSIEYVAIPFSSYPAEELTAFAKTRPELFKRASLSQITIPSSRKEAEQVLERVRSGAMTFEEAAKNHSKDVYTAKGGLMGQKYAWELRNELKNPDEMNDVLALGQGALSSVYETYGGAWAFYRVDAAASDPDLSSAEFPASVSRYLTRYERGRMEDWAMAEAERFAATATGNFAEAAAAKGLTVKSTEPFPLNYGNALTVEQFSLIGALEAGDKAELRGAERSERFFETVFSLEAGQVSRPFVLNGNAMVLRIKEIVKADADGFGLLEAYYPTLVQQDISRSVASTILKSPSLKDNFELVFARTYQ